jgi:hypothetical protein
MHRIKYFLNYKNYSILDRDLVGALAWKNTTLGLGANAREYRSLRTQSFSLYFSLCALPAFGVGTSVVRN